MAIKGVRTSCSLPLAIHGSAVTHYLPQDFKDQVAHHFVTIPLMVFSYSCNMMRMPFLVLLLHECSEILLEVGAVLPAALPALASALT